jgi:hypothetical protein
MKIELGTRDEWKRVRAGLIGVAIAALVWATLLLGCASTQAPEPCEPVYVESGTPQKKLPVPNEPESELERVDDSEQSWAVWLTAIGVDLASWKAYSAELLHVIQSHNEAIPDPPTD